MSYNPRSIGFYTTLLHVQGFAASLYKEHRTCTATSPELPLHSGDDLLICSGLFPSMWLHTGWAHALSRPECSLPAKEVRVYIANIQSTGHVSDGHTSLRPGDGTFD